jgi:5-methylcytosine-specific restriction endonuclease McrA
LPSDIAGVVVLPTTPAELDLEAEDFFEIAANRQRIREREGGRCFYCFKSIDGGNWVIEHVVSRPQGTNAYRNVVAACKQCNDRKKDLLAEDWLRALYRDGVLNQGECATGIANLARLRAGELKPS